MKNKCSIIGCQKESRAKGLCITHYGRVRKGITDMRAGNLPNLPFCHPSFTDYKGFQPLMQHLFSELGKNGLPRSCQGKRPIISGKFYIYQRY